MSDLLALRDKNLANVNRFCQSLAIKDLEGLLKLCAENITLSYGPYNFVGREELKRWVKELWELFPVLSFEGISINFQGNTIKHEFMMWLATAAGHRGILPCTAIYEFNNGLIQRIKMELSAGILRFRIEDSNIHDW